MSRLVIATVCLSLAAAPAALADSARNISGPIILAAGPPGGTPPGLAKKPGGMPPGQYKKLYQRGQTLPQNYYTQSQYFITQPQRYQLPAAPAGQRWVLVDDNAYLVQNNNGTIANVVTNAVANLLR